MLWSEVEWVLVADFNLPGHLPCNIGVAVGLSKVQVFTTRATHRGPVSVVIHFCQWLPFNRSRVQTLSLCHLTRSPFFDLRTDRADSLFHKLGMSPECITFLVKYFKIFNYFMESCVLSSEAAVSISTYCLLLSRHLLQLLYKKLRVIRRASLEALNDLLSYRPDVVEVVIVDLLDLLDVILRDLDRT